MITSDVYRMGKVLFPVLLILIAAFLAGCRASKTSESVPPVMWNRLTGVSVVQVLRPFDVLTQEQALRYGYTLSPEEMKRAREVADANISSAGTTQNPCATTTGSSSSSLSWWQRIWPFSRSATQSSTGNAVPCPSSSSSSSSSSSAPVIVHRVPTWTERLAQMGDSYRASLLKKSLPSFPSSTSSAGASASSRGSSLSGSSPNWNAPSGNADDPWNGFPTPGTSGPSYPSPSGTQPADSISYGSVSCGQGGITIPVLPGGDVPLSLCLVKAPGDNFFSNSMNSW